MMDRRVRPMALALCALAAGIAWDFAALALSDRFAGPFPAITDVVADRMPLVDLSRVGEVFALTFVIIFLAVFLRYRRRELPYLLTLVGLFYVGRGTFLLLLPIGAPAGASLPGSLGGPWLHPNHSFFPSGHFGLMSLLCLTLEPSLVRNVLTFAALAYAVGALLTRAHYTADLLGGLVLAYAVYAWGERNLRGASALRPA